MGASLFWNVDLGNQLHEQTRANVFVALWQNKRSVDTNLRHHLFSALGMAIGCLPTKNSMQGFSHIFHLISWSSPSSQQSSPIGSNLILSNHQTKDHSHQNPGLDDLIRCLQEGVHFETCPTSSILTGAQPLNIFYHAICRCLLFSQPLSIQLSVSLTVSWPGIVILSASLEEKSLKNPAI